MKNGSLSRRSLLERLGKNKAYARPAIGLIGALCLAGGAVAVTTAAEKVDVCHVDGGGRVHQISVAEPAVPAHLGHGDFLPRGGHHGGHDNDPGSCRQRSRG
jgi:hypothetical protein